MSITKLNQRFVIAIAILILTLPTFAADTLVSVTARKSKVLTTNNPSFNEVESTLIYNPSYYSNDDSTGVHSTSGLSSEGSGISISDENIGQVGQLDCSSDQYSELCNDLMEQVYSEIDAQNADVEGSWVFDKTSGGKSISSGEKMYDYTFSDYCYWVVGYNKTKYQGYCTNDDFNVYAADTAVKESEALASSYAEVYTQPCYLPSDDDGSELYSYGVIHWEDFEDSDGNDESWDQYSRFVCVAN